MAKATLTVTFVTRTEGVDPADASISVELDSDRIEEIYGESKSQFLFGEAVPFKVYPNPFSMTIETYQSDGVITANGEATEEITEVLVFAMEKEASLAKQPVGSFTSIEWLKEDLGGISIENGKAVIAKSDKIGIAKVTYNTKYKKFTLSGVEDAGFPVAEYPVVIVIIGAI